MNRIKQLVVIVGLLLGVGTTMVAVSPSVGAINVFDKGCSGQPADSKSVCGNTGDSATSMTKTIINTLLMILGIIAVIMIIVGGVRYVISAGNASSVTGAKNTVLYAVVGLVVALLAYAIVNFVITSI